MSADLDSLVEAEHTAFVAYRKALQGDDGPTRFSPVSPKRVRERRAEWYTALEARTEAFDQLALELEVPRTQALRLYLRGEVDD